MEFALNTFKSAPPIPAIYELKCVENNKTYIGATANLKERLYNHARELSKGIHKIKDLNNDFVLYGIDKFIVKIIYTQKYLFSGYNTTNFFRRELNLIRQTKPQYNRRGKKYDEPKPYLSITTGNKDYRPILIPKKDCKLIQG